MDNIGVRFLLGDIALLKGDHHAALQEYLKGAPNSPAHWYQAGLIAFREGDYVAACTYLRRGIAANPYMAEGLNGRTVLTEHLYWHGSNVHGPEWAIDYLEAGFEAEMMVRGNQSDQSGNADVLGVSLEQGL